MLVRESGGGASAGVYPSSGRAAYASMVFFLTFAFAYADRNVLALLYEPIRLEFHLNDTAASLLGGVPFSIVYSLAAIPLGRAVDHLNRRLILVAAATIWSIATVCCGLSHDITQLVIARIGVGFGEAALGPAVVSLISDYVAPNRRGRLIGLTAMGSIVGSALARIGGGALLNMFEAGGRVILPFIGDVSAWRAVFIFIGAPGLIVAAMLIALKEPSRKDHAEQAAAADGPVKAVTAKAYFREHYRLIACVFCGYGLFALVNQAVSSWTPIYALRHFHISAGTVGEQFGFMMLFFGGAGPLLGGWISDKIVEKGKPDARVLVGLAGLAGTTAVLLLPLARTYAVYLTLSAVHAFFAALGVASAVVLIQDLFPNRLRGQANSIYGLCTHLIGGTLGPLMVAVISDYVLKGKDSLLTAIVIVFVPATMAAFVILLLLRMMLRAKNGEEDILDSKIDSKLVLRSEKI